MGSKLRPGLKVRVWVALATNQQYPRSGTQLHSGRRGASLHGRQVPRPPLQIFFFTRFFFFVSRPFFFFFRTLKAEIVRHVPGRSWAPWE